MLPPIVALFIILGCHTGWSGRGCWPSLIRGSPGRLRWEGRAGGGREAEGEAGALAAEHQAGALPRRLYIVNVSGWSGAAATLEPGSWSRSMFGGQKAGSTRCPDTWFFRGGNRSISLVFDLWQVGSGLCWRHSNPRDRPASLANASGSQLCSLPVHATEKACVTEDPCSWGAYTLGLWVPHPHHAAICNVKRQTIFREGQEKAPKTLSDLLCQVCQFPCEPSRSRLSRPLSFQNRVGLCQAGRVPICEVGAR